MKQWGALGTGDGEGHAALGPLMRFTFLAPHLEQLAGLVTVNSLCWPKFLLQSWASVNPREPMAWRVCSKVRT